MTDLDDSQKAVLRESANCDAVSVFGAPGTGKSYTLRALVKEALVQNMSRQIIVLTTNRRSASDLRNQLSLDLAGLTTNIQVRSITAFAYEVVAQFAQTVGRRPPELITGPDQDAIIKEAFEIALSGLPSPLNLKLAGIEDFSAETINLPAFRADFRDLITRSAELQLSTSDLRVLSAQHGITVWELGAQLAEAYEKMLASAAGIQHAHADQVDHARLSTLAAQCIRKWREAEMSDDSGLHKASISHWDLVLVDDVQNAPLSLLELLRELQASGAKIVTFGDPDAAIASYRGGVAYLPMLFTRASDKNGLGAKRVNLSTSHRVAGSIAAVATRIQMAIHTAGGGSHRKALINYFQNSENKLIESAMNVSAQTFVNERAQIAFVANEFKRLHLEHGISYGQMAVITRSAAEHTRLRRLFEEFELAVEPEVSTLPLRETPLVREIISLIALTIGDKSEQMTTSVADVLSGRLFGYSASAIRRITRELHGWGLLAGDDLSGSDILEALVLNPDAEIYTRIPELEKLTDTVRTIKRVNRAAINVQEALWEIWNSLKMAESLQQQALNGGDFAVLANDGLDAVLQLFRFVQRMVEREGESASLKRLLDLLEVQDLPEDSIAKSGNKANQVALSTAASAVGQAWEYVAVINLNDGNWPNRRIRNPLTKVPQLTSIVINSLVGAQVDHSESSLRDVIDDELRMFLVAVTRAGKQLYLCGVESEDANASAFLKLVTRQPAVISDFVMNTEKTTVEIANFELDSEESENELQLPVLRHIPNDIKVINFANELGKLRLVAKYGSAQMREDAKLLIRDVLSIQSFNQQNVANFDQWIDELTVSTNAKISGKPKINPSKVEKYLDCPLSAFYEQIGARTDEQDSHAREVGALIHKIIELHPNGGLDEMLHTLEEIWSDYLLEIDQTQLAVIYGDLEKMLRNYDEYAQQAAELEKYTEISARYSSEDYDVYARIDRVECDPDNPHEASIIDFKTGKNLPSDAKAESNPQLRVYQWLMDLGHVELPEDRKIEKSAGARLFYLQRPVKSAFRYQASLNSDTLNEVENDLAAVAEYSKGPQFLAKSTSDSCTRCTFRQLCPAYEGKRVFS